MLKQAYEDVLKMREETFEIQGEISKVRRFFAVVFGITFGNSEMERNFEAYQSRKIRSYYARKEQDGQSYPTRLSAIPEQQKRSWAGSLNCTRCYSIWSIVWIFFAMSFVGWIWEVLLFVFMADSIYSSKHPNVGKGITDYESGSVRNEKQVVLGYMPQEYIG